ncbi:MAG: ribulose-phosphate 3-epimerase [Bacteroidales bacterium]|nr:ribulose-phosphate 3-epimerase [Bacteroidales bacterium]
MHKLIAPSLLSCDFGKLREEIEMLNHSVADWIHIDVMDGLFVPNISFGFPVLKFIKKYAKKPLDVHLMIVDPDRYISRFAEFGADIITVHYEACTHLHRTVQLIRENGVQAGVVLNPHTNVLLLEDIVAELDLVLIMSVNPGYGGQQFIERTYRKIELLKSIIEKQNITTRIEVDGGVDLNNARKLAEAGADVLVAGNSIFATDDPAAMIRELKTC